MTLLDRPQREEGQRRRPDDVAAVTTLRGRLNALTELADLADGRLDDGAVNDACAVLGRAGERLRLSGEHTVVALAGATGSGKSSLFNAIAGIDLSPVGVRRPTTGKAHACVWGLEGTRPLLEWLGIENRHRYARATALDADAGSSLQGLVLLDLPDHDSTETRHREEVDRLVSAADLLVWVVDPQKYADAAVHERYLRRSVSHQAVTTVVLNQVDSLPTPDDVERCADDLRELLSSEGLVSPRPVLASARTGAGLEELSGLIAERVAGRQAAAWRLTADLDRVAGELARLGGCDDPGGAGSATAAPDGLAEPDPDECRALVVRLDRDAGVEAAAHSAERRHRQRGMKFAEWPPRRLARWLRADPFKRLRLTGDATEEARPAAPVQSTMVAETLADAADPLTAGLPQPWQEAGRRAVTSRAVQIAEALGVDVVDTQDPEPRAPRWWGAVRVSQWLFAALSVACLAWLGCILGFSYAAGEGVSASFLARGLLPFAVAGLVVAVLAGLLLASLAGRIVRREARSVGDTARTRMGERVEDVAQRMVVEPLREELERYARFRALLREVGREDGQGS